MRKFRFFEMKGYDKLQLNIAMGVGFLGIEINRKAG